MAGTLISIRGVEKRYGQYAALQKVSLDIFEGEFLCIIGPSGCGKTTLLRILAGFVRPDAGQVALRGRSLADDPPNKRPFNLVFQNYALFPHMDVFENVAFGLRLKRLDAEAVRRKVDATLELVDLPGFGHRRVFELSGGQQQRVALARALALDPVMLLLDEPLGALDQKVRRRMQEELKRLQRDVGITFVHVTHDQEEALAMADRIAVMNRGRIEQVAAGRDIYAAPATRFVAEFVGECNRLNVRIIRDGTRARLTLAGGLAELTYEGPTPQRDAAAVYVRHEDLLLSECAQTDAPPDARVEITDIKFLGEMVRVTARLRSGDNVIASYGAREFERVPYRVGDAAQAAIRSGRALFFDPAESG